MKNETKLLVNLLINDDEQKQIAEQSLKAAVLHSLSIYSRKQVFFRLIENMPIDTVLHVAASVTETALYTMNIGREIAPDRNKHQSASALTQWCSQIPMTTAGPNERAGFMLAPV